VALATFILIYRISDVRTSASKVKIRSVLIKIKVEVKVKVNITHFQFKSFKIEVKENVLWSWLMSVYPGQAEG